MYNSENALSHRSLTYSIGTLVISKLKLPSSTAQTKKSAKIMQI